MPNINYSELTCNENKIFAEILKKYPSFKFKNGKASREDRNSIAINEILEISRNNPDLIFTATFALDCDMYDTSYICTYKGGQEIDELLLPNYNIYVSDDNIKFLKKSMGEETFENLYNKAVEIFTRMDIVKENDKGKKYIDFIWGVSLRVEDENYLMELTKNGSRITEIKCFRKDRIISYNYVSIGCSGIDLPF